MRRILSRAGIFSATCLMAACSLWPAQPPLPQVHDFGPTPALDHKNIAALQLNLDAVTAPAWLASDAIHYRLLYDDPTAFRSYANHRWVTPPAELLTARIQYLLSQHAAADSNVRSVYMLSANLLEFEQDFGTAHAAQVSVAVIVSMRRSSDGQIIAAHQFVMMQSAAPDVHGAISGLAQLANRTAAEIVAWAQTQVHD